jgi:molecular chaperone GrpE
MSNRHQKANHADNPSNGQPAEAPAEVQVQTPPTAPEPPPAPEPAPEVTAVADPREMEIALLKDRLLRLQADFDNFRKRTARDREDMARRAAERILMDLLPVVDHFELGLHAAHKHHVKHAVLEGFEGVLKQLQGVLERAGIAPVEARHKPFDPTVHECVAQVHSEEHAENVIIEETRKGYMLGQYLLRAAQVIVSCGPADAAPTPPPLPSVEEPKSGAE